MREYNFCEKPNCPCGGDPDKPKRDDGGPAFPMPSGAEPRVNETTHYNEGMTLRDYFAAKSLGGAMVNAEGLGFVSGAERASLLLQVAGICYEAADAMLAARVGPERDSATGGA